MGGRNQLREENSNFISKEKMKREKRGRKEEKKGKKGEKREKRKLKIVKKFRLRHTLE